MDAAQAKRLGEFAVFLKTRIPHEKFNFSIFMSTDGEPSLLPECNSVGCAVGWLPAFDPAAFAWDRVSTGYPDIVLRGKRYLSDLWSAKEYFGLDQEEGLFLFTENASLPGLGKNYLGLGSTPLQVASNIERFLRYRESGIAPSVW